MVSPAVPPASSPATTPLPAPEASQHLLALRGRWIDAREAASTMTERLARDGAFARQVYRHTKELAPLARRQAFEPLIFDETEMLELDLLLGYFELLGDGNVWVQAAVAHCRPDSSLVELAQSVLLLNAAKERGCLDRASEDRCGSLIALILHSRGRDLVQSVEVQFADVWLLVGSKLLRVAGAAQGLLGHRYKLVNA